MQVPCLCQLCRRRCRGRLAPSRHAHASASATGYGVAARRASTAPTAAAGAAWTARASAARAGTARRATRARATPRGQRWRGVASTHCPTSCGDHASRSIRRRPTPPPFTATAITASSDATDGMGDKKVQDCEPWSSQPPAGALPVLQVPPAAAATTSASAATRVGARPVPRCVSFGKCDDWNDKLGEWRRHSALGGAGREFAVWRPRSVPAGCVLPATLTSASTFVDLVAGASAATWAEVSPAAGRLGATSQSTAAVRLLPMRGGWWASGATCGWTRLRTRRSSARRAGAFGVAQRRDDGAPVSVTPCRRFKTVPPAVAAEARRCERRRRCTSLNCRGRGCA